MAANSTHLFSGLQQHLTELYDVSTTLRKRHERVIRDCRELLKPWPKKVDPEKPKAQIDEKKDDNTASKPEDEIPAAEFAALQLAEKALAQAQRLRQKQVIERENQELKSTELCSDDKDISHHGTNHGEIIKTKPPDDAVNNNSRLSSSSATKKPVQPAQSRHNDLRNKALQQSRCQINNKQRSGSDRLPGIKKVSSASQSQYTPFGPGRAAPAKPTSGSRGNTQPAHHNDNGHYGVIKQSTITRVLGQNGSASSSRSATTSSGGSERDMKARKDTRTTSLKRSAHMSAPFNTKEPAARVKNRPTRASVLRQNQLAQQRSNAPSSASSVREQHHKRVPSTHRPRSASSREQSSHQQGYVTDAVESIQTDPDPPHMFWSSEESSKVSQHTEVDPSIGSDSLGYPDKCIEPSPTLSAAQQLDGSHDEFDAPEKPAPLFNLLKDGQSLTLPAKLKRAFANNNKLRHQLDNSALIFHAKRENSPPTSFINKLTEHYDSKTDDDYKESVQTLALYKRLTQLMDKFYQQCFDGSISWRELIQTKRTMENICLLYADLEESFYSSVQDQDSCLQNLPNVFTPPDNPASIWLPSKFQKEPLKISARVKYRKLKDAEQLLQLMHEAQLLMMHLHTLDQAADILIPLLHRLDSNDSSFRPLYRAAYSLLCEGSQRQPVIISDIPDS